MGKTRSREFLEEVIAAQVENTPALSLAEDEVFKRYANKELPDFQNKTTASLTAYTGPWTETEVIHLLKRATFGVTEDNIQALKVKTMDQAVDYLLNNIPAIPPAGPLNNYNTATYTDPTGVGLGQTWVYAAYGDGTVNGKRQSSFKSWWMGQLLNQDLSILEKMVVFWHNHFATEVTTIGDARFAYKHNALLRSMALGNFKTLVKQVTIDPGMLRYLNGYLNTKTAPDENYARELMELFTLGKGYTPIYDEPDIQAAAKVLTGWRTNATTIAGYFDATKHDTGTKQFTSFFNNVVITGKTGANGANETDELIDIIFAKQETAKHICRKLYRFFVYYTIDATIETDIIDPLATLFINNNFEIKPVLAALLKSEHFYEVNSRACYIRTPLDYLVGTFRSFGITLPQTFTVDKQYAIWNYVRNYGSILSQDLGEPPNVAGWPAYYQVPEFYETWINSNTLPKRMAFTDMMLSTGFSAGTGTAIKIDPTILAKKCASPTDPYALTDYFIKMLLGLGLSTTKKASLVSATLLSGQSSPSYWSGAWSAYIANPNTANTNTVKTRLNSLLLELTRMAEHQLC